MIGVATAAVLLASAAASANHGGDKDCADFNTRAEAQAHFNAHPGDPDRLDADNDGLACESLPGGVGVGGVPVGGVDAGAGGSAANGFAGVLIVSGLMLAAGGGAMMWKARRT